jgi:outer membrane protein
MKQIIKSIIIMSIIMISSNISNAQKIGHINLQDLIKEMPELKKVQDSLSMIERQWETILKDGQSELERKYNEIQTNKTWPANIRQMKEKDFEDARAKLEATNQKAQEDLQEKQASLQEPVYEKAKKVINEVAKELGYSTVINSTGGYVLLVSNSADDLMGPVKKKMGIADKAMGTPISPKK